MALLLEYAMPEFVIVNDNSEEVGKMFADSSLAAVRKFKRSLPTGNWMKDIELYAYTPEEIVPFDIESIVFGEEKS